MTDPAIAPPSTRERILDIALELFTERGYDKTSVRDIAERLGTTKAALYYHFGGKADILFELHLRLHAVGERLLDELEALPDGAARMRAAPRLLDTFISDVDANRELMLLARRNENAFADLERSARHRDANDNLKERIARLVAGSDLSAADRVRITCAAGAVLDGLLDGALLDDLPHEQRVALVREVAGELIRGR